MSEMFITTLTVYCKRTPEVIRGSVEGGHLVKTVQGASQVWWPTAWIPAPGKQRQLSSESSVIYKLTSRTATVFWNPVSKTKTIKSKQNAEAGETARLTRAPTAFPEDPGLIPSLAAQYCLQLQFLGTLFVSDLHRDQVQTWCTCMQEKPTHA